MRVLTFESDLPGNRQERVRRARFEARSSLPVSAACVVANGVRETLSSLFATDVHVRLIEPLLPNPAAWAEIVRGAALFCARGPVANAYVIVRAKDAGALAGAAFGESRQDDGPLSPMETAAFSRAMRALASALRPVCGVADALNLQRVDAASAETYFEVLVDRPFTARIGVALSRDPQTTPGKVFCAESLQDVPVELTVEFANGWMDAAALLALAPGDIVTMRSRLDEPGRLCCSGKTVARGDCGASGMTRAFVARDILFGGGG